jgi:hypothetical protein
LELSTDPDSGELTQAELRSSLDRHTDQIIMRFLTWLSVIQATNMGVSIEDTADFEPITDAIGMPNPESELPDGFDNEQYSSEGEIDGVLYTFEKSGSEVVLTAVPAR